KGGNSGGGREPIEKRALKRRVRPGQHMGAATGSSRNVRHEKPVRHSLLEIRAACSGDFLPPSPPAEKASTSKDQSGQTTTGGGGGTAHSLRASAQVPAPGATAIKIVTVSTRPNRQNKSIRSRMSVLSVQEQKLRAVHRRQARLSHRARHDR